MELIFYEIILLRYSKYTDNLYTYKSTIPYSLGNIVFIPFSRGNKKIKGIILNKITKTSNSKAYEELLKKQSKIKSIIDISKDDYKIEPDKLLLGKFIREEYICSYFEALKLFMPPGAMNKKNEEFKKIIILNNQEKLDSVIKSTRKNAYKKLKFLKALKEFKEIEKNTLEEALDFSVNPYLKEFQTPIDESDSKSLLLVKKVSTLNDFKRKTSTLPSPKLTNKQEEILNSLYSYYESLEKNAVENKPNLIKGITGSGKTRIYLELIKKIRAKGKTVVILVPEIALTINLIENVKNEFNEDVAIIHSGLSKKQRFNQWLKIEKGLCKIILGARSCIFTPFKNLGLVVVDECHDEAYISNMSPKIDTIDFLSHMVKTDKNNPLLLLLSATPSVKQYYFAKKGIYNLYTLNERINKKPLPEVKIINMLEAMKKGHHGDLSQTMRIEIKKEIAKGNSVILFLNKRGYSNNLTCDNCGYVLKCKNCDITLTYHKDENSFKCHYCGYKEKFTKTTALCPKCNEGHFIFMNTGTQKIESECKALFPNSKIFRLDLDMSLKDNAKKILDDFNNSKSAILIGTQMIGKGHNFENVSLVGIINADQGVNSPDFKAKERAFSILEQVSGRAGRFQKKGMVIIQTYNENNEILTYLKNHDYESFYKDEIVNRKLFRYEPFSNIIRLLVISQNEKDVKNSSAKIKDALNFYNLKSFNKSLKIYNETFCLIKKIDNKFRFQIVIRCENQDLKRCKQMVNYILTKKRSVVLVNEFVSVSVDVNPGNML